MPKGYVEVVRSFTRKVNLGNYESADFFCSRREQVPDDEADEASARIAAWCEQQAAESAADFLESFKRAKR